MRTQPWTDRFRRALGALCPLERVRRALVGVSGGPDSVALLRLLADLRGEGEPRPFPDLIAAHVHHGIRGRDADLDAEFVKALAARLGVECLVARADAPAERRALRLSPEAAARAVRFRQFRAWAAERDAGVLFLAHHAEDQAETVLLRAVRGSGVRGLAGMAPVRPLDRPGGTTLLVRPLLSWSRDDILRYLEAAGETYRTDPSNQDLSVPRNRLRHEVLPVLEAEVQPGARRSLARLAEIAGAVARDLESLGRRALTEARAGRPGAGGLISVEALRAWPPSVVREALRLAVEEAARERVSGEPGAIVLPESACRAVLGWLAPGAPSEAAFEFGRPRGGAGPPRAGIRLEVRYGLIRVASAEARDAETEGEIPLGGTGPVRWLDWEIEAVPEDRAGGPGRAEAPAAGTSALEERVDAARVGAAGALCVRSPRPGDVFWPLGGPGKKPLREFLRERRVWPAERPRVPIVLAGEAIVWVVGHRIDHRFRLQAETARTLLLRARRRGAPGASSP